MHMMPHAAPCECICAHCACGWAELKKDYGLIEHESEHNLYRLVKTLHTVLFSFALSLVLFLLSWLFFIH